MDSVLLSTEIDFYIDTMKPQKLANIGSKQWLEWHQRLQKLNQEAVIEASALKDEHVKESLVSHQKAGILVHEAILINIWKHKVLPLLLNMEPHPESTFIAYSVLYHEAICVALLELVMYHASCAETLQDTAFDLLDYVCGTTAQLLSNQPREMDPEETGKIEILRQRESLAFDIGIRSLSIIRYLAEYLDRLPLNISTQMFSGYDVPVLLIEILLDKPWFKSGKLYSGGKWMKPSDEALGQAEAQVWLALHQLLLSPTCATHYTITNSRRVQLVKLQPLLHPILLDQVAPLMELKQWLCHIAVSDPPSTSKKPLLLEPMLEIKPKILAEADDKWNKIALEQLPVIFCTDQRELLETAKSLSEAYNTDLLEKFEVKQNACTQCGKNAIQRCSRCKKDWYCSRSCQVTHWPQHKEICIETTARN